MKIILEFDSKAEHDVYIQRIAKDYIEHGEKALQLKVDEEVKLHLEGLPDTKIDDFGKKRKWWSDYELEFLRENYATKNIRWIAKALRRKPIAVQQKLYQLYKKGLPKKQSRNGEVLED